MKQYQELLRKIMEEGEDRSDRTGVGTRSIFGGQIEFDLNDGFPAVTTKKLAFKSVVGELLWFINNETKLSELRYRTFGDGYSEKKTIWDANQGDFLKRKRDNGVENQSDDCGKIYGYLWHYNDQFWKAVDDLMNNPLSRRIMVNSWIPDIVNDPLSVSLPPCHYGFQLYVHNDDTVDLLWNQRSKDVFLGGPFNYASYSLLVHIICELTGKKPGRIICNYGDAHIYHNHFNAVEEQLSREPLSLPELKINKSMNSKKDLAESVSGDFELVGYEHHPTIKAPMAV